MKNLEHIEWRRDDFVITTDPRRFDLDVIHEFLCNEAYWSRGIPRSTLERSIANALGFALLLDNRQIGFARVTSDFATVAYLGDVFILQPYRGQGLSKWLMSCVMAHPDLQGLRRWSLATSDAHGCTAGSDLRRLRIPRNSWSYLTRTCTARLASQWWSKIAPFPAFDCCAQIALSACVFDLNQFLLPSWRKRWTKP